MEQVSFLFVIEIPQKTVLGFHSDHWEMTPREGSERSTQTAMTRSGMPPEPTEKTDEENTDGSASVGGWVAI